jgi:hypothetical protein
LRQQGFKIDEISKSLGLPVRSIQHRLNTLEQKLRNQMDWRRRGTRDEGRGTRVRKLSSMEVADFLAILTKLPKIYDSEKNLARLSIDVALLSRSYVSV